VLIRKKINSIVGGAIILVLGASSAMMGGASVRMGRGGVGVDAVRCKRMRRIVGSVERGVRMGKNVRMAVVNGEAGDGEGESDGGGRMVDRVDGSAVRIGEVGSEGDIKGRDWKVDGELLSIVQTVLGLAWYLDAIISGLE
jgi:hypothetical protein